MFTVALHAPACLSPSPHLPVLPILPLQVFRDRVSQSFHPEMPPVAFGDLMVNVNNRLVPEETPLSDGDLVILARDKLKI